MADGEIRIAVRATTDELGKDLKDISSEAKPITSRLKDITKHIATMGRELEKTKAQYDALMAGEREPAELKQMSAELRTIQSETRAIEKENADLIASYDQAIQKLEELRATGFTGLQLESQIAEVDRLAEQLRPIWEQLDASEQSANGLRAAMDQIRLHPETSQETQDLQARMEALGGAIDEANAEADRLGRQVNFQEVVASVQRFSAAATDLAKRISSIGIEASKSLGILTLYAVRGAKSIGSIVLGLLGIRKQSRGAATGIGKLSSRLVKLAKNVFFFSLITTGLRNIRQLIADLLKTNTDMAASLNAIQVNLLTAFAPIWEYIQPGLISFLAVMERATAAVAIFFAMLGGQTYEQAKAAAQALYEQAKALKETGNEADKSKKKLAGFDRINQQAQDTADTGLDFGVVAPPDFSWLDELREAIGDWYDIGEFLALKLTEFLDNIDWGKIQASAKNLAQNIVDFINGFLDNPALWVAVGQTIAQGLNTALIFLDTLLSGLHWETFGRNFGMMLNAIVSDFDWKLLGKTMGDYVNAVFGFLLNAVITFDWANLGARLALGLWSLTTTVNWDNIALALTIGLNGALLTLYTFLTSYDWGALGAKLASSLNLMVTTIRWADIGATIAALFNSAINFLYQAITTFKWGDVGTGLAQAINKLFNDIQWAQLGQMLSNLFKGVLDFIITAIQETDWFKIGKSIGDFFANIDWKTVFEKVGRIIGLTLGGIFSSIWAALGADARDVEKAFKGLVEWLNKNRETIGQVVEAALILIGTFAIVAPLVKTVAGLFTFLASPIGLATLAIGLLVAGIVSLSKNWDKLTPAQRTITMLSALVAAALAAALAIGIFHTSWTAGLAAAAIAAGAALLMNVSAFKGVNLKNPVSASTLSGIEVGTPSMPSSARSMSARLSGGSPLPQLAKGGIVDQATVAMIGERGKEAVLPLDRNTEWMDTLAERIAAQIDISTYFGRNQAAGSNDRPLELVLDGRVLGRMALPYIQSELDRIGVSMSQQGGLART